MRIAITSPSLDVYKSVNGISTVVRTIMKNNSEHQYFHYLLGSPDRPQPKISRFIYLFRQLVGFPISLKKQEIEIVHQNVPLNAKGILREYLINWWCRLLHVPVVAHIHGGEFLMNGTRNAAYRFLAKSIFDHAKAVIVLSRIEKEALQNHFRFSDAVILSNCVDSKCFPPKRRIKTSKIKTLLYMGRITESKGVADIIEALKLLKGCYDYRFILCGEGPLRNHFVSKGTKIIGQRFEYRGIVSGDEKLKAMHDADIFILPSLYGEGLPMALLESMATGLIPVVSDDASMRCVVRDRENGLFVKKNNPDDIVAKINELIDDDDLFLNLSQKASETVCRQYDIENYIRELNMIYI